LQCKHIKHRLVNTEKIERVSSSSVKTDSARNTEEKDIFAKDSQVEALCYLRNDALHRQPVSLATEQCRKALGQQDEAQPQFLSLAVDALPRFPESGFSCCGYAQGKQVPKTQKALVVTVSSTLFL